MKTQHIKAILFDLDGTLLKNDMRDFMNRYYQLLTARFAHLASAKNFLAAMDKAAHAMIANPGTKTNAEVFDEVFFSMVGFEKSDSLQIFEDFYQTDFPKLYKETKADPEAPLLVHKAKAKGIICVLATNPLFPHAATRQRLNWAGLQMDAKSGACRPLIPEHVGH
jgi:FMN phosphatase YigB (HAD superfamily)